MESFRSGLVVVVHLAVSLVAGVAVTSAGDWPQWRGPNRDAVSNESGLLPVWEPGPQLAWRAAGLGEAYSSVVVHQGVVYTMGRHGQDVFLSALDLETGQIRWSRMIGTTSRNICSTPTIDDDRIYALDPDGDLVCVSTSSGQVIWTASFLDDFGGRMMSGRGYGESPLIDGERLICTPGGAEAMMVALDKHSGAVIWKSTIPNLGDNGRDGTGFSSMVVSEAAAVRQYVQLVGRGLIGVEAETGRFLWGYNSIANATANIPTPIARGEYVFAANGYHAGCVLLRLADDGAGGIEAREVYAHDGGKFQNHHGGVVLVGDHVFGGHGSNNGLPTCLELETGKIRWKRRGPGTGSASVVYADGHLYFRYQDGLVALIEATPDEYRLKGTFQLPVAGGDSWPHPVISHGKLLLREKGYLFAYDLRKLADSREVSATDFVLGTKVFQELRNGNATVDSLSKPEANRSTSIGRFTRFLLASPGSSQPIALITLTDKQLTADGRITVETFNLMRRVTHPMVLSLGGTSIRDNGLRQLAELPLIGLHLELCQNVSDASLTELGRMISLQALWLTGTAVTQEGLQRLAQLPHLVALDLEVCDGVTDASCDVLVTIPKLRALVLKKTGFESERISDVGLESLARLQRLELLDLYGNRVTDAGGEHLGRMASLRSLDLSLTPISDKALPSLAGLKQLQELSLLYSEGFAGPAITDEGLKSLASLNSLRSLNLTAAKITDSGLAPLTRITQLRDLRLANTRVTDEGVRRLQAALPDCEVRK